MTTPAPPGDGLPAAPRPAAETLEPAGAQPAVDRVPATRAAPDTIRSQRRLVWLLTASAILLLVAAVGAALWWERQQELDTATAQGVRQVARLADELTHSLELAKAAIAQDEARLQRAAAGSPLGTVLGAAALERAPLLALLPFPFVLHALDAQGQVLDLAPNVPSGGAVTRREARPPPSAAEGAWQIGATQRAAGARIVPLLRRAAPNSHGVAAYTADFDHAALVRRFEGDRMPDAGGAALFRIEPDGSVQVLARAPHVESELGRRLRGPLMQALVRAPSGTFDSVTQIDPTRRVVAYQRLGGDAAGLVVTYGISSNAVLAGFHRLLPLAALVTALLAAGMQWGGSRLGQSLRLLATEQEALARSENQFRALADNLPDVVVRFDADARHLYANPAVTQATGLPPAALIGKTNAELGMPADMVATWTAVLGRVFADGATERLEFTFEGPQGLRDWESLVAREPQRPGQASTALVISRDVTARKQAEAVLREREELLRKSELRYRLAATGGQVWEWDLGAGRVDFATAFWLQLGQATPKPQDIVTRFEELLHPDDVPRRHAAMRSHLRNRTPYELEFRARHANGEWRWFHTQGQAVWDANGRATYMAGTTFDITPRKQAEDALRAAEAYQRKVFEQLADGVVLIDTAYRILDANPRALQMLGYRREELLRLGVRDVLPASELPRTAAALEAVVARRPDLAEWELLRQDGSRFVAEVSARPLGEGRYVLVVRDITQRRAAEKALLNSQLELSELTQRLLTQEQQTNQRIAQALHDHLGQTLAAARLNLDACITTHAAAMPAELKAQGQRIAALLDRAVREVRQVLVDLRPPLLEEQGLAAALDNEISSHAPAAGQTDVLLEVGNGGFDQRWPADVTYAAFMVAREAVANARQHAGASLIRVVLEGNDASLRLNIIDNGRGVPEQLVNGRPGHLGMVGMRERAIAIGAHFKVEPGPLGGTSIGLHWQAPPP
jgi:PAS domain S-box-containing protein